jgi:hypothetical protein
MDRAGATKSIRVSFRCRDWHSTALPQPAASIVALPQPAASIVALPQPAASIVALRNHTHDNDMISSLLRCMLQDIRNPSRGHSLVAHRASFHDGNR